MDMAFHCRRIWHPSMALAIITAAVLMYPAMSRADDTGLYAGRTLPSGVPGNAPKDQAQAALEPGSAALSGDTARLQGERIFGGYRFGPGFAVEAAQTRSVASGAALSNDTISVAGLSSVPLSDSVRLVGKLGLNYPTATVAASGAPLSDLSNAGRLYGVGVSVQVRDNVEVRAQTEHLGRPPGVAQGATAASDSVLLGAKVTF